MPYVKRAKTYRRKFTKRNATTLASLSKKVNKLTQNAIKSIQNDTAISANNSGWAYRCPQYDIVAGTGVDQRDGDQIFSTYLRVKGYFQADDPEGNLGRFLVVVTTDGTVPTFPSSISAFMPKSNANGNQYLLADRLVTLGAVSTGDTSNPSYYVHKPYSYNIKIPKRFQKNQFVSGTTSDNPTNAIFVAFISDSAVGAVTCQCHTRLTYWE